MKKRLKNITINTLKQLLSLLGVRTVEREGVFVAIRHPKFKDLILFVRHQSDGKWSMPGGGIKQAEFSDVAAKREVFEETGLIVGLNPNPIAHLSFEIKYGFYLLFEAEIVGGALLENGNGKDTTRCQFFHKDNLPNVYNAQKGNVGWLESYSGFTQYGHPNKPPIEKYRTEKQ